MRFSEGDEVRVDIPNRDDPDFHLHRKRGVVVEVIQDDTGTETGDERDSSIYRVEIDGKRHDLRWRDLRPL